MRSSQNEETLIHMATQKKWRKKDDRWALNSLRRLDVDALSGLLRRLDKDDWGYQRRTGLFALERTLQRANLESFILCHLHDKTPAEAMDILLRARRESRYRRRMVP